MTWLWHQKNQSEVGRNLQEKEHVGHAHSDQRQVGPKSSLWRAAEPYKDQNQEFWAIVPAAYSHDTTDNGGGLSVSTWSAKPVCMS